MIENLYISWDDLKRVYRKHRRKMGWAAVLGFVLGFGYFISRPPIYLANGTFKESSSRQDHYFDMKNLMRNFSETPSEGATAALMLSRTVLSKVIEELGLQVKVKNHSTFKTIGNNILLELRITPSEQDSLEFKDVHTAGPVSFYFSSTSPSTYDLFDAKHQKILSGTVGEKITTGDVSFTVGHLVEGLFSLTVLPTADIVEELKRKCSIKPLKGIKSILEVKFSHPQRKIAAAFINSLMKKYEEFLIEENKTVIGSQLSYLNQRQDQLSEKLDHDTQNHVALLRKSLREKGFMGIEQEIESILEPLQTYRARLHEIEVEMEGLEKRMAPSPAMLAYQYGQALGEKIQEARQKQSQEVVDHLTSRQKALEESIHTLETDFQGITLETARQFFEQYCRQLDELHTQLKQVVFFRDHLHEPHFEMSTLANILNDAVTQQFVQRAGDLESQLSDSITRSEREHERVKETLNIQKNFLQSHLTQTLELGKIRIQLIKEKIGSLHGVMKELLVREKGVLENKISELKQTMENVPELWHLDKQLQFKAQLTKGMMEGLTQIAESKNLSRHLYQVESQPIDPAMTPLTPKPPYLLIKAVFCGLFFAFLLYFYRLFQSLFAGLPASLATLRLMGAHTSGDLSSQIAAPFDYLAHRDLETLREMGAFLLERKEKNSVIGLLSEKGSPYCFNLAQLLSMHNQKILIIDCNFDRITTPENQPGLWHYLHQKVTDIPMRHRESYDFLPAGYTSRHGIELLTSSAFAHFLEQAREKYDFIFLLRQTALSTHDAHTILKLSDLALISTEEESQETLKPFVDWSRQKDCRYATFIQYV